MTANGQNTHRVLMIAGGSYVHSVVFRQVAYMRESNRYTFSGFGFGKPVGRYGHTDPTTIFDRFESWHEPNGRPRTFSSALRFMPHLAHGLIGRRSVLETRTWKERAVDSAKSGYSNANHRRALDGYDLYHWHCFAPDRLSLLKQLRPNSKVIMTLWGSDLYRVAGVEAYARQFEACGRATVFTMATPEMRATFLAKFGHRWANKVRLLTYGACNLATIDSVRPKSSDVLRSMGVPSGKILVSVGNSAAPGNQHLPALEAIKKLDSDLLKSIAIVIPVTYPAEQAYVQTVRNAIQGFGTSVTILDRYLSDEEVSALRCSINIAVHVPISDQFSAAMCEALYAGAVLITGSWLPYSILRSNNIVFHEVSSISDLTVKLHQVIVNLDSERRLTQCNAKPVWDLMSWETVTPKWLALYDDMLNT